MGTWEAVYICALYNINRVQTFVLSQKDSDLWKRKSLLLGEKRSRVITKKREREVELSLLHNNLKLVCLITNFSPRKWKKRLASRVPLSGSNKKEPLSFLGLFSRTTFVIVLPQSTQTFHVILIQAHSSLVSQTLVSVRVQWPSYGHQSIIKPKFQNF